MASLRDTAPWCAVHRIVPLRLPRLSPSLGVTRSGMLRTVVPVHHDGPVCSQCQADSLYSVQQK